MANTPRFGRENQRRRYVLGFAFDPGASRVALIERSHGVFANHDNGLGGAVAPGETYAAAMRREFLEEAGTTISAPWELFAILEGDDYRVFCYRAFLGREDWRRIRTSKRSVTDEPVIKVSAYTLHTRGVVEDVNWLVSMAIDTQPRAVVRIDRRQI